VQGHGCCEKRFTLEFQDSGLKTLGCASAGCSCDSQGCNCWPKSVRQAIRFSTSSKWMVVWHENKKIHEEPIPDAPRVKIKDMKADKDGITLVWDSDTKDCWYLVHWYDERADVWRGVAPRQQKTSLLIPSRLFNRSGKAKVRVLATQKIATGYAEADLSLPARTSTDTEPHGGYQDRSERRGSANQATASHRGCASRYRQRCRRTSDS
jgi:hypothetical protein